MISVIIPIYNSTKYLCRCLDSVCSQTYTDLEIILIDDGSTDKSGNICDDYAKRDPRIVVVHKENGGVGSARNTGLEIATGDFIGFVDSDDYIPQNMYQVLIDAIDNVDVVASCCTITFDKCGYLSQWQNGKILYKNGEKISSQEFLPLLLELDWNIDDVIWNKLYRRNAIKNKFKEGVFNEDYLFLYYLFKSIYDSNCTMAITADTTYYYCENEESITKQTSDIKKLLFFDEYQNVNEIISDLKKWNPSLLQYAQKWKEKLLVFSMEELIKYPELFELRPVECNAIKQDFKRLKVFNLECRTFNHFINVIVLAYLPFLWVRYRQVQNKWRIVKRHLNLKTISVFYVIHNFFNANL